MRVVSFLLVSRELRMVGYAVSKSSLSQGNTEVAASCCVPSGPWVLLGCDRLFDFFEQVLFHGVGELASVTYVLWTFGSISKSGLQGLLLHGVFVVVHFPFVLVFEVDKPTIDRLWLALVQRLFAHTLTH